MSAPLAFVLAPQLLFQTAVLISTVLSNAPAASVRPPRKTIVSLKSCFSSQLITLEGTAPSRS